MDMRGQEKRTDMGIEVQEKRRGRPKQEEEVGRCDSRSEREGTVGIGWVRLGSIIDRSHLMGQRGM